MGFLDKFKRVPTNSIPDQFMIEGSSFDQKTQAGLSNYLAYKSLNSDYKAKKVGYTFVTATSMITSIYGGVVMGTFIFILAACMIESIKLLVGRENKDIVVIASIISLSLALYGLYNTLNTENKSQDNKGDQVEVLKQSITSIDQQIKELQSSDSNAGAIVGTPPVFDNDSYMLLVKDLTQKQLELDGLLKDRHTYWQRRPNRNNKRTGSWMLANYDKCSGIYCPKLKAKYDHVQSLKAQKNALEKEKQRVQEYQDNALAMIQDREKLKREKQLTIQGLIKQRNENQQKLLELQGNTKVATDLRIAMPLLFLLLVFVERYQYATGNSLSDLKTHRLRVNTLHDNYKKKKRLEQKAIETKNEPEKVTKGWFTKNVVMNTELTKSVTADAELTNQAKIVRRALLKGSHNELVVTGLLTSNHIKTLLKYRSLEKAVAGARQDGESMEVTLLRLLKEWRVTTTRQRNKELTAKFKASLV